jgi:hypothetical protein
MRHHHLLTLSFVGLALVAGCSSSGARRDDASRSAAQGDAKPGACKLAFVLAGAPAFQVYATDDIAMTRGDFEGSMGAGGSARLSNFAVNEDPAYAGSLVASAKGDFSLFAGARMATSSASATRASRGCEPFTPALVVDHAAVAASLAALATSFEGGDEQLSAPPDDENKIRFHSGFHGLHLARPDRLGPSRARSSRPKRTSRS